MIIDKGNKESAEVIGGVDTSNSMRMNLNAQSYELLLSNLYSDPLGSTIRELCTNALEANMASKTTKKVVVQLPSLINTNLIIRDFGTGLDDVEIDKYLNCLFSSSKGESNDNMGGFGLGSKSPLALVDSFYLSSVKDGVQYDYMWIKERGQIPTPIFQGSDKVPGKENGITITVPLGSSSKIPLHNLTSHVKTSANRQLFGFKDNVMIVNDATVPYEKMVDVTSSVITWTPVIDLKNITLFTKDKSATPSTNSRHYGNPEVFVRIGVVVYRYNANFDASSLGDFVKNIRDFVVVINVPIGLLDIPMSREEVNTTDDNSRTIRKHYLDGQLELEAEYKKIPFKFDVGAIEFAHQLKAYTNNSQVVWNVKANQTALVKHDSVFMDKILHYAHEYTTYKTINTTEIVRNIDLYQPLSQYVSRLPNYLPKTVLRSQTITSNDVSISGYHADEEQLVLLLPGKLPFGVRTGDLFSYFKMKYPAKVFKSIHLFQYKSDYTEYDSFGDALKTLYQAHSKHLGLKDWDFILDVDLNDLKDEVKKLRAVNKTTVVANDYLVGVRLAPLEKYYSDFTKTNGTYSWGDNNSNNKVYRVNKMLDSKGKTIPVGAEYVDKYDKVFLTVDGTLPIKGTSSFNTLAKTEMEYCLKNTCYFRVSEANFDKVKTSFDKEGIEYYTSTDLFEITVPSIEDQYLKDPTDSTVVDELLNILSTNLRDFFVTSSWRLDKIVLATAVNSFMTRIKDNYNDKSNTYFKLINAHADKISHKIVNTGNHRSTHSYNAVALQSFSEEVKELLVQGLVENRSIWLKDYSTLTTYSDSISRDLFTKFGYNF